VALVILTSLRFDHPQASRPSFEGALRQSSPKVARSACYSPCFSLLPHSSLRICSKVILTPPTDEVRRVLLSLFWSHTLTFDFATWSSSYHTRSSNLLLDPPLYRIYNIDLLKSKAGLQWHLP
jgi:hypothetical protein